MRKRIRPQFAGEKRRGAALVETAIVLPVFFLVVLGIIEFGRAFMVMQLVNTAAREANRMAISDGVSNADVTDYVKDMVATTVTIPESKVGVGITVTAYPGNPDPQNEIANARRRDKIRIDVSVAYTDVSFLTPKFLAVATLRGASIMRHE